MTEQTGRYGHHPDPGIDAEVEIDRLQGALAAAHAGLLRGLDFRAASPEGLAIKHDIRWTLSESGGPSRLGYRR